MKKKTLKIIGYLSVFAFLVVLGGCVWARFAHDHAVGNSAPGQIGHRHGPGYAEYLAARGGDGGNSTNELPEKIFVLEDVSGAEQVEIRGQRSKEAVRLNLAVGVPFSTTADFLRLRGHPQRLDLRAALPMKVSITERGEVEIDFPGLPGAKHRIDRHLRSSSLMPQYLFYIFSPLEFYTYERGDYEGLPQYRHFDGEKIRDLTEQIVAELKSRFATDKVFPPFKLDFSDSYIRFEEVRYCCQVDFDASDQERVNYRKIFILDRETLKVLEERKERI